MAGLLRPVRSPFFWLIAAAFIAGLFSFRDFGLTWDEPLFYKYADALGYAYTPANWVSGHFDLNLAYGPSGDDHKNRGPGYLLLAREPVSILRTLGLAESSAWHLFNFITFLPGVFFVYRIARRFVLEVPATLAAAAFATQPLLWGHGFINPKDVPFMVFFTGAFWAGLALADKLVSSEEGIGWGPIVLPALLLGLASSNRILGPLAGLLVIVYFLVQRPRLPAFVRFAVYGLLALAITFGTWPYLWESPLHFLDTFRFMAANPTSLPVLFAGSIYPADGLPRRYLPFFLVSTLTEPVWPAFLLGVLAFARERGLDRRRLVAGLLLLVWFALPVAYVALARPPIYDGMRHFLFVLPPVFVFIAIGLDWAFRRLGRKWISVVLAVILLAPGLVGIIRLHPFEYTYYNSLVGGTGGAFRRYETDYWLTCYKQAMEALNKRIPTPATLYVHREAEVAAPYAGAGITVLDQRGANRNIVPGDYLLVNTRTNEDRSTYHEAPEVLSVGRDGATFCVVKRIP